MEDRRTTGGKRPSRSSVEMGECVSEHKTKNHVANENSAADAIHPLCDYQLFFFTPPETIRARNQ
jgi:hypothetical protein